jgi:hypothetical protein
MSAAQLRELLFPVLDFNARNKEEAYLDTVPPKAKEAIQAHHVLVGMNTEMLIHAMGKPPRKVREKDGETEYEEWIYGTPPQDVDFVRIIGDEVVRVETMRVGGQKIVRTEKEVILKKPDQEEEAKKEEQQERPANAPSLRRPGEDPSLPTASTQCPQSPRRMCRNSREARVQGAIREALDKSQTAESIPHCRFRVSNAAIVAAL